MGVLIEVLGILSTVAGVLGFITLMIFLVSNFVDWRGIKGYGSLNAKMKFSQWLDLYHLNKNGWYISSCHVGRRFSSQNDIYIEFSYIDYLRYKHWYKNREKHEKNNCKDKNLIKVLEAAQKDIDRAREESANSMRATAEQVEEVSKRIKNEQVEEVSKRIESYASTPLWALADDSKFAPLVPGIVVWDMDNGTYRIAKEEK